jgi:hypothetical protein
MYTTLEDKKKADIINYYMKAKPDCTLKDIIQDCYTTRTRLSYLERCGLISLPDPIPFGLRNKKYYENKALQSSGS